MPEGAKEGGIERGMIRSRGMIPFCSFNSKSVSSKTIFLNFALELDIIRNSDVQSCTYTQTSLSANQTLSPSEQSCRIAILS